MLKKGQGVLSKSGSIYIHTLRLSLAQQMGAIHHSGSALTPISEASSTCLWLPCLMHSCQGMEMFLLQLCSAALAALVPCLMHSCQGMEMFLLQLCSAALAALVKLTYWPLSPQNNVVSWFHKVLATYRLHSMGGGGGSCQCLRVW